MESASFTELFASLVLRETVPRDWCLMNFAVAISYLNGAASIERLKAHQSCVGWSFSKRERHSGFQDQLCHVPERIEAYVVTIAPCGFP